jgi:hypothetical protein
LKNLVFACALASATLMSAAADAAIYNIDATSSTGTSLSLKAGVTYKVEWIGTADGGAYDSANVTCGTLSCASGFTNAITSRDPNFATAFMPGGSTVLDIFTYGSLGTTFNAADASLAAYQSGPINVYNIAIDAGTVGSPALVTTVPSPFTFIPDVTAVNTLVVTDVDATRTNNAGGVSLRITALGPVPEPGTWALSILGFGLVGAAVRSRKAAARYA